MTRLYYWIRGFIYGLFNYEEYEHIQADIISCDNCAEEICEEHSDMVNRAVYGEQ